MLNAAALNAMAANVFDFDDTHIPTIIHPTAPVAAAIFALSQTQKVSGNDFLHALILGMEIECRIGNVISPAHYSRGWHITSTCGVFGSALAAGKLLNLTSQQLNWALGSASAQASGLVETLGTMSKSMSVGNAARNGLLSAILAKDDFSGPEFPLDGERGFLNVFGEKPTLEDLDGGLGSKWELLNNTYKPYPCGVVLNPVIQACLGLHDLFNSLCADVQTLEYIELTGNPLLRQRTDRPNIRTGRESQVSAQHAVGICLLRGKAGLLEFSDEAVADPRVAAIGKKLRFIDDTSMSVDAVKVCFKSQNQDAVVVVVDHAKGSLKDPLTDSDLEQKLRDLVAYGKPGYDPEPLIDQIWAIEKLDDVGQLMIMAA
jgi:2-methylcitrate dehydratase PrpD